MGALSHYLEEEGLPTTQISLIREHSEKIRPPRALWVPFELGRPLGLPGDAAFQTRVLLAALRLLERDQGPILEDFLEEAPAPADQTGWACPVALAGPAAEGGGLAGWRQALGREMGQLRPWYDQALRSKGRTTVGVSGLSLEKAADLIAGFVEGQAPASPPGDASLGQILKLATEDLKAYYLEAALAQPGSPSSGRLADWFWGETAAGRLFLALPSVCLKSDDPDIRLLGQLTLVPRSQAHRLEK